MWQQFKSICPWIALGSIATIVVLRQMMRRRYDDDWPSSRRFVAGSYLDDLSSDFDSSSEDDSLEFY